MHAVYYGLQRQKKTFSHLNKWLQCSNKKKIIIMAGNGINHNQAQRQFISLFPLFYFYQSTCMRLHLFFQIHLQIHYILSMLGQYIIWQSHNDTYLYICVCASVFCKRRKENSTLLMTFTHDNCWEYQHTVFVFMEMNYCFGIKTCSSCWAHNAPLVSAGTISWLGSTFHLLYGHFDDSFPFAHA